MPIRKCEILSIKIHTISTFPPHGLKKIEFKLIFILLNSLIKSKVTQNHFIDFRAVFNVAKVSLKLILVLERNVF